MTFELIFSQLGKWGDIVYIWCQKNPIVSFPIIIFILWIILRYMERKDAKDK